MGKKIFRWQDYVESILIAVLLALVVRTFVMTGYRVPTTTMAPTLYPGDFIFSFRLPFGLRLPLSEQKLFVGLPDRGDVVVFTFPEQPRTTYVKRVVGLPGDLIEIKKGQLSVNGQPVSYEKHSELPMDVTRISMDVELWTEKAEEGERQILRQNGGKDRNFGPISVPQDEVFLLGDNRDASDDSRYWGTVPVNRVEGRVFLIWLSLDWKPDSSWPRIRWERVGHRVGH